MLQEIELPSAEKRWQDTGPPWFVFRCERDGTPMRVGFVEEEYAYQPCSACGARLIPTKVESA